MATPIGPTAPYEDDVNQQNLETSVTNYDTTYAVKQEDDDNRLAAISLMLTLLADGNMDGAMVVAETQVIPGVVQQSIDEQNLYACSEEVGASLDAFGTTDQALFNNGANFDPNEPYGTTGMTADDATTFEHDQADLWWDLNSTTYVNPVATTGNIVQGNYLWMVDDTTKSQLSDSVNNTMTQFGVPLDPTKNIPEQSDAGNTVALIQNNTNKWWETKGTDGQSEAQQIDNVLNDFDTEGNTCNGQIQSANSLLQNQIQITDTYQGDDETLMASQEDEETQIVANQKSS